MDLLRGEDKMKDLEKGVIAITEESKKTPVAGKYDVIVCGGGPSGFIAAIASARKGAKTLLIERYGFLGGTATAGMMVEFGSIYNGTDVLLGGVTHEFLHCLTEYGGAYRTNEKTHHTIFDPESMIMVCQNMVLQSKVTVRLHTLIVSSIMEGNKITGVITESKSGREAFLGKVIIDATGDGDVAVSAGATYQMGIDNSSEDLQPVTLEVILGNVDATRVPQSYDEWLANVTEARKNGEWLIPTERIFSWGRVKKRGAPDDPHRSFFFINGTNVLNINGCDTQDLTRAEIESRNQVECLVECMRKYFPGFEESYLDRTAAQAGIRETRRIIGDYTLTRDDVLSARHFSDGVVPACNSIDVHDSEGKDFAHEYLSSGTYYEIPYRSFLPVGIENLLVTGRSFSSDRFALGSARVMVVCMPMGAACGIAAALASEKNSSPRRLNPEEVRIQLKKEGTILSP